MHIQQVQIKNFRCFEDLTVNLNPDINIFVGNNGSGKSAVLDAISVALYPYLIELEYAITPDYPDLSSPPIFQRDLSSKETHQKFCNESKFNVITNNFPEWEITYIKGVNDDSDSNSNSNHLYDL